MRSALLAVLLLESLGLAVLASETTPLSAPELIDDAVKRQSLPQELKARLDALPAGDIDRLRDDQGRTMLHRAARGNLQTSVLALLLSGADPNVRDHRGRTPVFELIESANTADEAEMDYMSLEMLDRYGADLQAKDQAGTTPLALAVEKRDYRKVEFLLWRNVAVATPDAPIDRQPVSIARENDDQPMLGMLAAAQAQVPATLPVRAKSRRIADALTSADLNGVLDALDAGWKIDEQDKTGRTALFRAITAGRADLVSLLLFEGADPNMATVSGQTPLMASVRFLSISGQRVTAMLLLSGADPKAADKDGETALTLAAAAGHEFAIQYLMWVGADIFAPTLRGSLMNYADHPPLRRLLADFGLDPSEPTPNATSTDPVVRLHRAAYRGNVAGVKEALENGVPADAVLPKDHRTALVYAVCGHHFELVDLLIAHGADLHRQYPNNGFHPLHFLAEWAASEKDGETAAKAIRSIVERGVDPNITMKNGMTPLMMAAKAGASEASTFALLEAGAKMDLRNKEGLTALGVARKFGREEMISFLQKQGVPE